MRGFRITALAFTACLALTSVTSAQEIIRDIYQAVRPKITIAVAGFAPARLEGAEDLGQVGESVLVADLKFTTIFDVMEGGTLPFDPKTVQFDQERTLMPGLNALKVQHLAVGQVSGRGREAVLEGRLFAVASGEMVLGKRYSGHVKDFRRIIHTFADDILFQLTGEKGVARTEVAFVSTTGRTSKELFVMEYDGAGVGPLTGNQSLNLSPRWSPDGRHIAYTSYQRNGDKDNANLLVVNRDSGRRTVLSARLGQNMSPAWSPDGQWLAFAMSAGSGINLHLMPAGGGEPKPLTTGPNISISPSFSPNGRQVVFNSDRGGSPQLYIIDVDGANLRRLTLQGTYNTSPRWSPRGDKIAFMCQKGGNQICLISPDGSDQQQLTMQGQNEDPAWAPNGRHIVFTSTRTGRKDIFVMHADGSEQRRLTNNGRDNFLPDWGP